MVSRRRILSRSRDDLNDQLTYRPPPEDEEDVWYQRDKLYKDHIQEVLDKWTQIDDEIWAKVIVFERNRRVAKAYARAPVLTVNGSDDGFDGFRIGLCGFENPMRDQKTDEIKRHIGHGVKIKMDDGGNILIKRLAKTNVYVKSTTGPGGGVGGGGGAGGAQDDDNNAIGAEILKLPGLALEAEKPAKLFDMKKFQSNVNRELRRAYPDRRRLECQCLSSIVFVKSDPELLDCPVWVLIVNIVAMDMLRSKLPPVQRAVDIKNRPRIPIPDEDPYSVAGNGSGGSSGGSSGFVVSAGTVAAAREQLLLQSQQQLRRSDKPPKLPPRENSNMYPHDIPTPDYDDNHHHHHHNNSYPMQYPLMSGKNMRMRSSTAPIGMALPNSSKDNHKPKEKKYEDPYYCGLRARVPNFVSKLKKKDSGASTAPSSMTSSVVTATTSSNNAGATGAAKRLSMCHQPSSFSMVPRNNLVVGSSAVPPPLPPLMHHHGPISWHSRSYESGIDSDSIESPYNQIYGRLPIPTRAYIPAHSNKTMHIGEWD